MIIQESSLFCELTQNELDKIIKASLNCSITDSRLMLGGMFNTTYFIKTDNKGDVILSVGPVNRHLIMPFEHKCMETEVMIFDIMKNNNIPASEVLVFDNTKTIIDRNFMIVKYIKSCLITDIVEKHPEKTPDIMKQFGEAMRKFHSVKGPRFGRIPDVLNGKGFARNSEFMRQEVEDWISVAKNTDFFTWEDFDNIRQIFDKYTPVFDEITEAYLVHGDVARTNALVDNTGDQPRIAAIIDPERGFFGDPEFDIAMTDYLIDDAFISGYGDIYGCDYNTNLRRKLYKLLRRMFDCYVWGAEYNQYDNMLETRQFVRDTIDELKKLKTEA